MNTQDEIYFEQLSSHREGLADALDDPALSGVKNSVVEKYSDQAHFVYELLQNADDAEATAARFVLYKDKLVFAHNGARQFSISNPKTEREDAANGQLGDINGITSIANSSKNKAPNKIGKFGVGFKSVFQYTLTPHIYDPNIFFRIDRFIVPKKISEDFPGRKPYETLFVFPFDHSERNATEAYEDISEKLRTLDYPLLFLSCLKEISYEISDEVGLYGKSVAKKVQLNDTVAESVCLTQNDGDEIYDDNLWLFSRKDINGNVYSVGFFFDEKENLIAKQHAAFCFFPTKEVTGLNFILHAPFLLTDSREGIRAGVKHNKEMIELLSALAADSLIYLRDIGKESGHSIINDEIFKIIPYDGSKFSDVNDKRKISFLPFYTAIKDKMGSEELLPTVDGYTSTQNAYLVEYSQWANNCLTTNLFKNSQLARITGNKDAKWVFSSLSRAEVLRNEKQLAGYLDSITNDWLGQDKIISKIDSAFIEMQTIEWLHEFYKYISASKERIKLVQKKPIFLNQDRKAVAAFDENGQPVLFFPAEDVNGYETVNTLLLDNEDTVEFIRGLGIKEPSLRDEIYNIILPKYKAGGKIDTDPHFRKFFKYYKECPQSEIEDFIDLIKECEFVSYRSTEDATVYRGKASELYFPNELLCQWFKSKPDTRFVELDEYIKLVGENDKKELISFLTELGTKNVPKVLSREISSQEAIKIQKTWPRSTWGQKWIERYIDGCQEIMEHITPDNSVVMWKQLLKVISSVCTRFNGFNSVLSGSYEYFFRYSRSDRFESRTVVQLRTIPWLLNAEGSLVSAKELTLKTISPQYDTTSEEAKELLQFLGIEKEHYEDYLTDEQRAKLELVEALSDIPPEELKRFAEQYRSNKHDLTHQTKGDEADEEINSDSENSSVSRIVKDISKRATSIPKSKEISNDGDNEIKMDFDEDDYIKPSIDFSKRIEQAKQRSAKEIAEIAYIDDLTQKAINANKYSFGWFKALLELELLNSSENTANSREISITFSKVEREEGTSRTLVLKHPSRYIPQSMEDLADIPLELHFADKPMVKVAVEVVNVKSYTLRAKLKTNAQIDGVDLSLVTEARIEAKNPVFLLEELRKAFNKLDLSENYDMQRNLCDNIEFVFGPPGTGKTTHLAREVLLPLMKEAEELKVLVLTPTNKAADVLVRRVMEIMDTDHSYADWLVRFGATNDSVIEQSGVFRDKTLDIRDFSRNVTVTTIARFPYDYFLPASNTRVHLSELKWDYIIIDEASMIPLVNIIFPLYKKTPKKFIIAGDPFQIEPITTVGIWKNENIYTMVELKSFSKPTTIPHQYPVKLLTTQYRSIPEIGEVFSQFAYGGVLQHNRTSNSRRQLLIEEFIDIKPLNIIKFPVSKYESVYRPKRLQSKSNYQVYSALFVLEFVKYIASHLARENEEEFFRIGLIAPYRAQADLIDKLIASFKLPPNIDVQVGTIHGFQGDECDIIMALFNPPPAISASKEMFLNKLNIINVSISRARDYLFIVMPDDSTENVENLTMIKRVEKLCKEQQNWIEYESQHMEEKIFGSNTYLEDNSFSTSHQLVNVYGKPEKRYEVRSEDTAVDVQIHE